MAAESMQPFRDVLNRPKHEYVEEARGSGKKVVGFFCSYIPVELLDAAGVLAYRLKGISDRDIGPGTTYLSSRLCTFCRNALTLALEDDFSFLDGFIGTNTCDHVRRTSQNWTIKKPPAFGQFVHVPRVYREENISHFADELGNLKSNLEQWLGRTIEDEAIREAGEKRNRARALLRALSELRKRDTPPVSGSEMLAVSVAYQQIPVDSFLPLAEDLLAERSDVRTIEGEPKIRTLLAGGEIDDPDYIGFIEEQGIDVVVDPVCFGLRCYADDVDLEAPPIEALARRYLLHFPCARMGESFKTRWNEIKKLYDDYNADGILFQRLKFCQIWGVDPHNMMPLCEESRIPILYLEREYGFFSTGQLKTRLQAFTELIEAKKEFDG